MQIKKLLQLQQNKLKRQAPGHIAFILKIMHFPKITGTTHKENPMPQLSTHYPILLKAPLFQGFTKSELQALLKHLMPTQRSYEAGGQLLRAGFTAENIGVVLSGHIEAVKYTAGGGQFAVARMQPGGVFGDILAGGQNQSPVTVVALSACHVLYIPRTRLFAPAPPTAQELLRRLLANLLAELSRKYFAQESRTELLLLHGIRRRLAAYLLRHTGGTSPFTIEYNRTQLAAYLGCERSALSREISRMVADGLIETQRSRFKLCNPSALRALL